MTVTDLFGNEEPVAKAKRSTPLPSGHAGVIGAGPSGETCGSCGHLVRKKLAKVYLKCGLMRQAWTGGAKTDVRSRDAACEKWVEA